ncbi:MAG: prefoldin subunit alpha [Candidatus Diapherotrites archaeon]
MPEEQQAKTVQLSGEDLSRMHQAEQGKLQALGERANSIQRILMDQLAAIDALKELKSEKEGNILVPLGAGTFIEAKVGNVEKVKSSVANNVMVEMEIPKAIEKLEKNSEQTKKELEELQKEQNIVLNNIAGIENIFAAARKQMQQKGKE